MNKYNIFSVIFGITVTALTVYWILFSNKEFLLGFSVIWWVVIFFMGTRWIIEWASGSEHIKDDRFINLTLLLFLILLVSTPYIKKFLLWGIHTPSNDIINVYFIPLLFLLVIVIYGLLWLGVAYLRITYLNFSKKNLTFIERIKIIGVVIGMFLFVVLMLKLIQLASVKMV